MRIAAGGEGGGVTGRVSLTGQMTMMMVVLVVAVAMAEVKVMI